MRATYSPRARSMHSFKRAPSWRRRWSPHTTMRGSWNARANSRLADDSVKVSIPRSPVTHRGDTRQHATIEDEHDPGRQQVGRGSREPRKSNQVAEKAENHSAHPRMRRLAAEQPSQGALPQRDRQCDSEEPHLAAMEHKRAEH